MSTDLVWYLLVLPIVFWLIKKCGAVEIWMLGAAILILLCGVRGNV